MNKIIIKGNISRDVDFTKGKKDKPARCTFSVAVNRNFDREKADFFFCSAFGKTAEIINEYFSKGSQILISGRMESYKNDDDITCWSLVAESVEFCGNRNDK